ncbi:hypothetical protein SAMN02745857_02157 [Andreprevotia lacus DSM 23236]|jgi:hypothetical protein|uniref:Uncharacterized protein n=1 Tax=Andreprevotia lacus DSM 23236 TaxID=1121001 RepID=A0A1W1XN58_9NEIS|nr:hypothetical protein [Andreprevotia lacus]SMC25393.1 hypothetical protein SAMN02745857_02157 [Andreprevotia lacus DSM 23236]
MSVLVSPAQIVASKPFLGIVHLLAWAVRAADITIVHSRYAPASMPAVPAELAHEVMATLDGLDDIARLAVWSAIAGRVRDRKALARLLPQQWRRRWPTPVPLALIEAVVDEWIGLGHIGTRRWDARCGSHMRIQRHKLWLMEWLNEAWESGLAGLQARHATQLQHLLALPSVQLVHSIREVSAQARSRAARCVA